MCRMQKQWSRLVCKNGQLKHVTRVNYFLCCLSSGSCFSSKHLRKSNRSKQTASYFVMKFPSKEFPVKTIQFLWYFSFELFPGTQLKMCFPQCHLIILNYTSVVCPFGRKCFSKPPITSTCLLCSAVLGFPLLFLLFFPQREYHSSPGKFSSLNFVLGVNFFLLTWCSNGFQILSHGFDVLMFLWSWNGCLILV